MLKNVNNQKMEKENSLEFEFLGKLREIAADAKNLRVSLDEIRKVKDIKEKAAQEKELNGCIKNNKPIIQNGIANLKIRINDISKIFDQNIDDPDLWAKGRWLRNEYGDEIAHINNKLERFDKLWELINTLPDQEINPTLSERIEDLDKLLCSIINHSNLATIPNRLNECLGDIWTGQCLNFWDQFNDELCKKECVNWFLDYFNKRPTTINGIVNFADGTIIKASSNHWRQGISFIFVAISTLIGFLMAWGFAWLLITMKYPITLTIPSTIISNVTLSSINPSTLDISNFDILARFFVICYGLILGGSIAHILLASLKQQRGAKDEHKIAIEGWLRWFHINEIKNIGASVSLWIGLFGLVLVLKTTDYLTAFLVGFGIDSFVDLFLDRFSQTISSQTAELKEKIPSTKEETPKGD